MKQLLFLLLLLPGVGACQQFSLAGRQSITLPEDSKKQLYRFIEKNDHVSLLHDQFASVPVYNLRSRTQKHLVDGIYFFTWGSHDSGSLFLYTKGKMTVLRDDNVSQLLTDYTSFLKVNTLSESSQLAYLSIITGFARHKYEEQKMLEKAGVLIPAK